MKYHITRENIEFAIKDENLYFLVRAILKILVPEKIKKIYFSSDTENKYKELMELNGKGLTMLDKSNETTLIRKERIIHYPGSLILVPVLSGIVKYSEWQPLCERIVAEYHENV